MTTSKNNPLLFLLKVSFVVLLISTSLKLYVHPLEWTLISTINLIFHEAGHVFFMPFGTFLHILGGTLGELLIPSIVVSHFYLQKNTYAIGFGLWWLSTALFSVSVYARDAQMQLLPLLGGDSAGHDWANILSMLGILEYDHWVGSFFLIFSFFICSLAGVFFWRDLNPRES